MMLLKCYARPHITRDAYRVLVVLAAGEDLRCSISVCYGVEIKGKVRVPFPFVESL